MFNETTGEASYSTLSKYKQKKYKEVWEDLVKNEMLLSAFRNAQEDGSLNIYNKLKDKKYKEIDELTDEILGEFKDKKATFKCTNGPRYKAHYDNTMMFNTISSMLTDEYRKNKGGHK